MVKKNKPGGLLRVLSLLFVRLIFFKNIKGTHTHEGYIHDENGTHNLTSQEKRMVDYVNKIWYNQEAKK